MSQTLATPPPPELSIQRGFFARLWADPDGRSTIVGVAGVIIIYLFLWVTVPYVAHLGPTAKFTPREKAKPKPFQIKIAENTFKKPVPKQKPLPNKFVEINPDAPENVPDNTTNFSSRNQQVAQEKPTPNGKSDMPAMQGKKDFESNQIVSGQLVKPIEQMEAVPPKEVTPPQEEVVQAPKLEQNPLKGFEKREGKSEKGFASNIAPASTNPTLVPNRVEGTKDGSPDAQALRPVIDRTRPQPRQTLVKTQTVRPAILAERLAGTTNIGPTAVDARWSNYGAYLQRMIDTVQVQWERLLTESKVYPTSGSTVAVKFIMDAKGAITKVVNVDSTASDAASRACMSAITDRSPYGDWTEDMIAVLGTQQEMTFTFYYQ